jgi:hypothetical protein
MTFRADGSSVVKSTDEGDQGVALAYTADAAQMIADALNEASPEHGRGVKDPLTGEQVDRLDVADSRPLSDVLGKGKLIRVTGPYVTVEMGVPEGRQIRGLQAGAILPPDVTAGKARHLLDNRLAEIVKGDNPEDVAFGGASPRAQYEAALGLPPTVGKAPEGSPAAKFEEDPEAAWRELTGAPAAKDDVSGAAGGKPSGNAAKEAWVNYATRQGMDRDAAEGMTRDELRDYDYDSL